MQHCPICKKEVKPNERYPNYICNECIARSVDEHGKPVDFSQALNERICFIDGKACFAEEAHMGGMVVRLKQ